MPQPVRLRAQVERVIDHARGLRSLTLVPERSVPRFRPGQFLHLALDNWDPSQHWPDSRPFSIASSPGVRDRLTITVSQVGRFTTRIMETKPGDTVWLKLPFGEFIVATGQSDPVVLVAGGTGIAPFASLVAAEEALTGSVRLLYGVGRADLLIYGDLLDDACRRHPSLSWRAFVEEGELTGATRGRLTAEAVLEEVEALQTYAAPSTVTIYLSGPPAMTATLTAGLMRAGIEPDRIRVDSWD